MRTWIELLHKQAHHLAEIFKSSKSQGLLVSLASVSRSWIIKELQITGFVANLLCSGRPVKLFVHAKSIYRSTDAKKWWQTFLVKKFFFLQSLRKDEDRSAFSVCAHEFSLAERNFEEKSPFAQANYCSICREIPCELSSKNHRNKERNSCISFALLLHNTVHLILGSLNDSGNFEMKYYNFKC